MMAAKHDETKAYRDDLNGVRVQVDRDELAAAVVGQQAADGVVLSRERRGEASRTQQERRGACNWEHIHSL